MIVYTCPECGRDLTELMLASCPPIPQYQCLHCGWTEDVSKRQGKIIRIPFDEKENEDEYLKELVDKWKEQGLLKDIEEEKVPSLNTFPFMSEACKFCSNNPANGGSGICNCTIPYMNQTIISGESNYNSPITTTTTAQSLHYAKQEMTDKIIS